MLNPFASRSKEQPLSSSLRIVFASDYDPECRKIVLRQCNSGHEMRWLKHDMGAFSCLSSENRLLLRPEKSTWTISDIKAIIGRFFRNSFSGAQYEKLFSPSKLHLRGSVRAFLSRAIATLFSLSGTLFTFSSQSSFNHCISSTRNKEIESQRTFPSRSRSMERR